MEISSNTLRFPILNKYPRRKLGETENQLTRGENDKPLRKIRLRQIFKIQANV